MADCNMTRNSRSRQTRINAALQSGYCSICHIPYNSLEDHLQSKKHQKLIGEDANYISLNSFSEDDSNSFGLDPFINLNGIESIDISNGKCDTKILSRMPRLCDRLKMSPTENGHRLRSRKQINYAMSPTLDEDSFEAHDTRSRTRIQSKLASDTEEVWNSGRPKRSCLKPKRPSADERLVADNKNYYKVEVLNNKLRSSGHFQFQLPPPPPTEYLRRHESPEKDDKGNLIVKFKKLRNSELTLLNNEAENFLFPKRDDSSSEEDNDEDNDEKRNDSSSVTEHDSTTNDTMGSRSPNHPGVKVEDETSMESTCSGKRKKKRRTQVENFLLDNQKYYKFETTGSRLRYQGSFFPDIIKPENNSDIASQDEKPNLKKEEPPTDLVLENYTFSFEQIPIPEPWYITFQRQDQGKEYYYFLPDEDYWNPFIMPYQMGPLPPIDPKVCITEYHQIKKLLESQEVSSGSGGSCSTPEYSDSNYTPSSNEPDTNDEDSKMSTGTLETDLNNAESSSSTGVALEPVRPRRRRLGGRFVATSKSGNPRKSPRQHASTLAILSSLIKDRKRKSRSGEFITPPAAILTPIEEQEEVPLPAAVTNSKSPVKSSSKSQQKQKFVDFTEISRKFSAEIEDFACEDFSFVEGEGDDGIEFRHNMSVLDVLKLYDEQRAKDDHRSTRRFINGSPGRKPGRRKKKNRTGWPNRKRGLPRNVTQKDDDSTIDDSNSVNLEDSDCESTDSINNDITKLDSEPTVVTTRDVVFNRVRKRKPSRQMRKRVVKKRRTNLSVRKRPPAPPPAAVLTPPPSDGPASPKRTNVRQRRMPASPRSPRLLRKPRGRWYKER